MSNTGKRGTRELALCGMLAAMAMVFGYIESLLPIPYPFPGMRLGFANIAIIAALYLYGPRDAFIINIIRIVLSGLLFGNFNTFVLGFSGGMVSTAVMSLLKKTDKLNIIAVSAVGGVCHNITQVAVAMLLLSTPTLIFMTPIFIVLGVITGAVCGVVARLFVKHVNKTA
ncbi:Gx transporter family protein [Howardella ureilytica]|nr:Gx transporter family protein [Lachnospiraceae bacterium]MDY2957289.1 Gx transporter family protein [Lachnospiraceae bacterium]